MPEVSAVPAYQDPTTARDDVSRVNFVLSDPWSPPVAEVCRAHQKLVLWLQDPRMAEFKEQLKVFERELLKYAMYRIGDDAMQQYATAYGMKQPPMMRELLNKSSQAMTEQQRAALVADVVKSAVSGMQAPVVNVKVPTVPVDLTLTMPDRTETITVKRDSDGLIKSLIKRVAGAASA